jgi:hypothetical protein
MARFTIKNIERMENLIEEVGETYGIPFIDVVPNFIGGRNAYCNSEVLKAIDKYSMPYIYSEGVKLTDCVYVKFYLELRTDVGDVKTLLYSSHIPLEDTEEIYE